MKSDKEVFLLFFKRLKPFWPQISLSFLCDALMSFLAMLVPLFATIIFDYAYPHRDLSVFTLMMLLMFLLYFAELFCNAHIDYLNIYVSESLSYRLTRDCFEKVEHQSMGYHSKIKVGDTTVRLTVDIPQIIQPISQFLSQAITQTVRLGFFLVISFLFDPLITLLVLGGLPLYLIEIKFFSRKLQQVNSQDQENQGQIVEAIQSKLRNIRTIQAFNQQKREVQKLDVRLRKSLFLSFKESLISIATVFSNSFTTKLWITFVLWYIGYEVIAGELSVGQALALGFYLPLLEEPVHELADLYKSTKISLVSMRRVEPLLGQKEEKQREKSQRPLTIKEGKIEFKNVTFAYKKGRPVFKNFDFCIEPKTSVAIVGESGAGKSTLLNLIARFFNPQRGHILIDGQNIQEVDVHSLRAGLGIVFQEASIIEGTIRENILYGSPIKSYERMIQAAREACAHDFITASPQGYATPLTAQGETLSAGQRQRIAIARALLRKPKILILDEATSALDAESEFFIREAIQQSKGKRTILIVAHRLSTIKEVDRIIVFRKGKIVEEGSFQTLMDQKGYFFTLYNMQFGGFQKFIEFLNLELQRAKLNKQDLILAVGKVLEYDPLSKSHDSKDMIRSMEEVNLFFRKNIRPLDFCCVYDLDKIALCFPQTELKGSLQITNKIQQMLQNKSFNVNGTRTKFHMAMGYASYQHIGTNSGEHLLECAMQVLGKDL